MKAMTNAQKDRSAFLTIGKAAALATLILVFLLTSCQKQDNTINVQGTYEHDYKPDQAEVFAGVSVLEPTAEDAQDEATRIIGKVVSGLKAAGIQESDIQTEQLSLYEERTYTESGGSRLLGWRATQMLRVKTNDLSKVGQIIDISSRNGVNQIGSINFMLSPAKEDEYRQIALAEASKSAKAKAEAIAASLGVRLGALKTVTESNFGYIPYIYTVKSEADNAAAEAAVVLPSDVTITASISLVYYVK
jgi:uncharacterized protein